MGKGKAKRGSERAVKEEEQANKAAKAPTAKTRTLMAKLRSTSIGACTMVVERTYESERYMPLRISKMTDRISEVIPMIEIMQRHGGMQRIHHR